MKMIKDTFEFENKIYFAIELEDFKTADGYNMDHAVFADEDFCEADDGSLGYRMIDEGLYGYLPRHLIETGNESEIRKFIVENIG